jgi:hypothetical protein
MQWKHGRQRDPVLRGAVTLSQHLAALGLLRSRQRPANGKHIPPAYLRASIEQRLALLQGLMDTDGHIDPRGRCEFTTVLPRLADDFSELLYTLGIKHTVRQKEAFAVTAGERRRGRTAHRFSFMVYNDRPVFCLTRKRRLQASREGRRTTETERRRIVAVEPVPSVPVRCIQVDSPSRLYLAGRAIIPTHNTELVNNAVGYYIDQDPAPIMVVVPTERDAEAWSKDRFSPMARDTPCLAGRISDPKSRDGSNKNLHKRFPGGAPDHRRRQRALGARQPADPRPALRRGRPLSVQRRRRGLPGPPREEAHRHLLEPQDRAGVDADDPRRQPDRDRLRRERPAAVLGAVPGLRHPSDADMGSGPLGEPGRRTQDGDGALPLRRLRCRVVGRDALGRDPQG